MLSDRTIFRPDGMFLSIGEGNSGMQVRTGQYWVTDYDPSSGVSWADPPYLCTMVFHDTGYVKRLGLQLGRMEDSEGLPEGGVVSLDFTNEEGGGGYVETAYLTDYTQGYIDEESWDGGGNG